MNLINQLLENLKDEEFILHLKVMIKTRLKQENLVTKTDFDDKLKSHSWNINSNKTNHLLVENEEKKLKAFDSSLFYRQKSFWRRWYAKLFNISVNVQIFWKG